MHVFDREHDTSYVLYRCNWCVWNDVNAIDVLLNDLNVHMDISSYEVYEVNYIGGVLHL